MINIANLDLLFSGLVALGTGALGVIIFFSNRQSVTNQAFMALCVMTIIWSIFNNLFNRSTDPYLALWFLRLAVFAAVWNSFFLFQLFYIFPNERFNLSSTYKYWLIPLVGITSLLTLTPLVFNHIASFSLEGKVTKIANGPGIIVFALTILSLVSSGIIVLIKKAWRAPADQRKQYRYITIGAFITFSLIIIFNFVLPALFDIARFVPYGSIFIFPFIVFTAYALVRHNLLSVEVVASEALTFVIGVITLIEILFAQSFLSLLGRLVILGAVVFFGILLIRSARNEVRQREQLQKLTEELSIANERLKELDRQKTDFLSIAAHQLRTPLSILSGYIELIREGAYGKVQKETAEILNNMDQSNGHLVKLVDEFLNITRIEQGRVKFDIKPQDIVSAIEHTVKELADRAKQNGIKIVTRQSIKTLSAPFDEEKIRHVVFNFIDNAIKYSERGTITVRVTAEDAGVAVRVIDEGLGFGKTDEVNFFQKFYRGINVKGTNVNGTGLGLYVCKKFIEGHGGRIWGISPGPGKGSEFGFWIPASAQSVSNSVTQ